MVELLQPPYDRHVRALFQEAKERIDIVSPWVTGEGATLVPDTSGRTCRLLFRGRAMDFLEGSTELDAIEALRRRGFELFWRQDLHAKVYLTERAAIIGSANLTRNGMMEGNLEVAVRVEGAARDQLAEQVRAWFGLARPVSEEQLRAVQRWCEEMKDRGGRLREERASLKQATPREIGAPAGKRHRKRHAPAAPPEVPEEVWASVQEPEEVTRAALRSLDARLGRPGLIDEILALVGSALKAGDEHLHRRVLATVGDRIGLKFTTFQRLALGLARPGATRSLPRPRPGELRLDLILPPECRERLDDLPSSVIARRSTFDPHYRAEKRREIVPPLWTTFYIATATDLPDWIWEAWRRAVALELERGRFKGSPYRAKATNRHHPALVRWALAAERGEARAW